MVKSVISIISVVIILICGAIYETNFIQRQFDEMNVVFNALCEKIEDETATEDDVLAIKENWVEKKRFLHVFIPHNEIKELDLWINEAVTLVRDEKWTDAISKLEVLIALSEEIPKTFLVRFDNIL